MKHYDDDGFDADGIAKPGTRLRVPMHLMDGVQSAVAKITNRKLSLTDFYAHWKAHQQQQQQQTVTGTGSGTLPPLGGGKETKK